MKHRTTALAASVLAFGASYVSAQVQAHSVLVDPSDSGLVWTVNRDNNSVSVVDVAAGSVVNEITVGEQPMHIAFNADGSKLLVVNRRGNVPLVTNFVTPGFTGAEIRGSISVIDVATKTIDTTLTNVGTEPYGIALSPNGKFFVVTVFRSSEVILLDSTTYAELARHEYDWDLNQIDPGKTIGQLDTDYDGVADLANPRLFSITADSSRVYITHWKSPWISILDVTLDGSGVPTALGEGGRINQDTYDLHPINNPIPVTTVASQGDPTFSDDIALSPDGSRAVIPQVLLNINFDTTHDFGGAIDGAFANRVYPSLSMIDVTNGSFAQPGDASGRLEHELTDTLNPAEYVPFGPQGRRVDNGVVTLGGDGSPVLGGSANLRLSGVGAGDLGLLWWGNETNIPVAPFGTLLVDIVSGVAVTPAGGDLWTATLPIPNDPALDGAAIPFQAATIDGTTGDIALSNGVKVVLGSQGVGMNKMGYRAGQPYRADYKADGSAVLMLNQGSEDVFLYDASGSDMTLRTVFPPRYNHVERAAFDLTTAMGDRPVGWVVVPDPTTVNDDALVYIQNEVTTSLSVLRVDYTTGAITKERDQIVTITGPDKKTVSERIGEELFHDASRAQTTGNFNNSCYSCHAEGGEDGKSWDRPAGPRTTMPVYGGPLGTGLLLWKGTRINLGETGPMFGGENGGHGIFTDAEQQGLIDYHKVIPFPLNPNLDPVTGDLTPLAALGQDLFHGTNDTGLNPTLRAAGCANCHPREDDLTGEPRLFTADHLDPMITDTLDFGFIIDDFCITLQENIVASNLRAVNSQVNSDEDGDGMPEMDRNLDGYSDIEGYTPIHVDADDDFFRDDPNSYPCPLDPFFDPDGPLKLFTRPAKLMSIPTKLAVIHTGPYMHDNSMISLRHILDPESQMFDPVYGDANYPTTFKWYNEFHDLRGHEDLVPLSSKVQVSLVSTDVDADIEAVLAYISSL